MLPIDQAFEAASSSGQAIPLEERLRLLLEPDDSQESIETAKSFLHSLGTANFDDANVVPKIREYVAFLQSQLSGEELAIVDALMAKMDSLPPLRQSARQLKTVVQEHTTQRDILETKTIEFREGLQKRREDIATCDKKLAELEAFKAEIEK